MEWRPGYRRPYMTIHVRCDNTLSNIPLEGILGSLPDHPSKCLVSVQLICTAELASKRAAYQEAIASLRTVLGDRPSGGGSLLPRLGGPDPPVVLFATRPTVVSAGDRYLAVYLGPRAVASVDVGVVKVDYRLVGCVLSTVTGRKETVEVGVTVEGCGEGVHPVVIRDCPSCPSPEPVSLDSIYAMVINNEQPTEALLDLLEYRAKNQVKDQDQSKTLTFDLFATERIGRIAVERTKDAISRIDLLDVDAQGVKLSLIRKRLLVDVVLEREELWADTLSEVRLSSIVSVHPDCSPVALLDAIVVQDILELECNIDLGMESLTCVLPVISKRPGTL